MFLGLTKSLAVIYGCHPLPIFKIHAESSSNSVFEQKNRPYNKDDFDERRAETSRKNREKYQRRITKASGPSRIGRENSYSCDVNFMDTNRQGNIDANQQSQRPSSSSNLQFHRAGTRKSTVRRNYAVASNKNHIPTSPHILQTATHCSNCQALLFERESKNFCCSQGQILLTHRAPPNSLLELFTSRSKDAVEFRNIIRTYNNTFAFTSLGVKYDKDLCHRNEGIYTFRVQGQMYHYINELLPLDKQPSYLQLYFYDTEHEIENRLCVSDRLNPAIIEAIIAALQDNPYCQFFRSLSAVDDLEKYKIFIKNDAGLDQRVYNCPSASQVAAIWIDGGTDGFVNNRDILVSSKAGDTHKVQYFFGCYDPLQYPLLFPYGETGWHHGIQRNRGPNGLPYRYPSSVLAPEHIENIDDLLQREASVAQHEKHSRSIVSCREYYCYKLQIRPGELSLILRAGRLLQQYVVDMYIKIESSRLDYIQNNQQELRCELYSGIVDALATGEDRASMVGKRTILPASFIGGPRDMRRRYMDAMTLVQRYGKPDFFITMTCNPNWHEIKSNLAQGEEAQNRPDLISRIFRAKVEELKGDLFKDEILGPVAAYTYVIEFQKRGLPHIHILIILKSAAKILSPNAYDDYVCAELPSRENEYLRSIVIKHMLHGPVEISIQNVFA